MKMNITDSKDICTIYVGVDATTKVMTLARKHIESKLSQDGGEIKSVQCTHFIPLGKSITIYYSVIDKKKKRKITDLNKIGFNTIASILALTKIGGPAFLISPTPLSNTDLGTLSSYANQIMLKDSRYNSLMAAAAASKQLMSTMVKKVNTDEVEQQVKAALNAVPELRGGINRAMAHTIALPAEKVVGDIIKAAVKAVKPPPDPAMFNVPREAEESTVVEPPRGIHPDNAALFY